MQEREINLIDLIVEILLRWRMFLVWMLCGAVLLGGLSFIRSWRAAGAQAAQLEEAKRQLEDAAGDDVQSQQNSVDPELLQQVMRQLDEDQQQNVEYVLEYEEIYRQQLTAGEESVMLQMDACDVKKAVVSVWVTAEDQDRAFAVEAVYEDMIQGGRMVQYVADQSGLPVSAVSELISLSHKSTNAINISGYDSFTLSVIHADEQMCRNMMQAVTEFLEKEQADLQTALGEFDLTVVAQEPAGVYYPSIVDNQKTFISNILSMQDTIANRKKAFTEEQWQYYDVLVNGKTTGMYDSNEEETEEETKGETLTDIVARGITVTPGVSIKYVILGILVAVFCCAFYIFIKYIFNTKIRFTEDLQQIYYLPQLGRIPDDKKKKKFLGIVDRWVLSLRDRNKRSFSEEEAIKLASVAVKLKAERETLDSVSLIGCGLKDRSMSVCDQLKGNLSRDNIQVDILNNVLYDAQAMNSLENVKGVVLVERAGATLYTEINQELELLKRQGIKILGGIVVE